MARPRKVQATEPTETSPTLELTPDEIRAILAIRERQAAGLEAEHLPEPKGPPVVSDASIALLAGALGEALKAAQPVQKKNVVTRKKVNPWMPTDGSPKIMKFKRPMYHHGIPIDPRRTYNENCVLLDKIKPGTYLNGHVKVLKRKDNGYDIEYPIRTAAQRLKLINQFGITDFNSLLRRILDERADPRKYAQPEDQED